MVSNNNGNSLYQFMRIGNPLSIFSFKNKGCEYMEKNTNNIKIDSVEKMNINHYLNLDNENEAGQKSDGTWYIKSLKFNDEDDFKTKASNLNRICNELNKKTVKDKK